MDVPPARSSVHCEEQQQVRRRVLSAPGALSEGGQISFSFISLLLNKHPKILMIMTFAAAFLVLRSSSACRPIAPLNPQSMPIIYDWSCQITTCDYKCEVNPCLIDEYHALHPAHRYCMSICECMCLGVVRT